MRAWVLHENNNIQMNEVLIPVPKDGEILVKIKAAGICTSDIPRVFENGAHHYPIILGHEFSGITKDGQRVGVFPLLPCHKCESCLLGHYETCSNYSYIGSRQDGAYAEYITVPAWNLIRFPDNMTYEQAALLEPAAVALHAVRKFDMSKASNVAVIGNGAIGQLIAKWLTIFGVENVSLLGRNDTPILSKMDACFEVAGTTDAFSRCVSLAKPNSQIVLVGNPNVHFNINQKLYWQIMRKQITIGGIWNSSFPSDWNLVLKYADKLQIDSFISHKFKFNELDKALAFLHGKKEKHSKVVVIL